MSTTPCTDCKGSGVYVGFAWEREPCRRCGGSKVEPRAEAEQKPIKADHVTVETADVRHRALDVGGDWDIQPLPSKMHGLGLLPFMAVRRGGAAGWTVQVRQVEGEDPYFWRDHGVTVDEAVQRIYRAIRRENARSFRLLGGAAQASGEALHRAADRAHRTVDAGGGAAGGMIIVRAQPTALEREGWRWAIARRPNESDRSLGYRIRRARARALADAERLGVDR